MNTSSKYTLKDFKILYINLDRRPDRRQNIETELSRLGLKATRIAGVDARNFNQNEIDYWMSKKNFNTMSRNPDRVLGRVGCFLGHLKAIKYAIDNRLEPLLILEDDVKFLVDQTDNEIIIPRNADMFYLGGLYWWKTSKTPITEEEIDDMGEPFDLTFENIRIDNYYKNTIQILPKYFRIACAYAYVLPSVSKTEMLFNELMNAGGKKAIDMMYVTYIQKYDNSYIMNPSLCIQSDSFISDVTDLGEKTPTKPFDNSYFYDHEIYNNKRAIEFYKYNYALLLKILLKYYNRYTQIPRDPKKLFQHLRILYKDMHK